MTDDLRLVFTDLDGSLLDHNSYRFTDALPQIRALEKRSIPLIPATSKTRAEIEVLRRQLGNRHPFIAENGAAVFIPRGYFPRQPQGTTEREGYWVREWVAGRDHWLGLLSRLRDEFDGDFECFSEAGIAGIARMTGLAEDAAALADRREYSEPVLWLGSPAGADSFVEQLRALGATVQRGGRFLAVSGDCDKGRALAWLREVYRRSRSMPSCHDLAIGDSRNDCPMLEVARTALLVRSPVHDFPPLPRTDGVLYSHDYGPAGWAEGVARWLHSTD